MSKNSGFLDKMRTAVQTRIDGFVNTVTALGGERDKTRAMSVSFASYLQPEVLDVLYSDSDFVAAIVDSLPEHAFLKGIEIPEDTDGDLIKAMGEWGAVEELQNTAIWGRLHGGGLLVLGVAGNMEEPIDPDTLEAGSLEYLLVLDRRDFELGEDGPDGKPEFYFMSRGNRTKIHKSRAIFFGGARSSRTVKDRNGGWDLSVVQRPYEIIKDAATNWQSTVYLMSDASQAVFKIAGLMDMIAEGDIESLQARLEALNLSRSIARAITVDADSESFEQVGVQNLAGADALLDKTWIRVAAAARMPVTVLMGQSPAGMNATGESDLEIWFGAISAYQRRELGPKLTYLARVIAATEGLPFPKGLTIVWPALKQATDQEKAATRKTVAETDAIYVAMEAVLPEEIVKARWGGGIYSAEMGDAIDLEAREKLLEAALEDLLDPPEPPPMAPPIPPGAPSPEPSDPNAPPPPPPSEDPEDPEEV